MSKTTPTPFYGVVVNPSLDNQTRVQQFIELQTRVNNLIESLDGPTDQLVQLTGELELLGDSLNEDEIHEVCEWYSANNNDSEMYYEDVEWMVN
jgi:hypothetical protein